jgi:hypothetical protein
MNGRLAFSFQFLLLIRRGSSPLARHCHDTGIICAGRPHEARRLEHFSAGFEIASHFTGKPTFLPTGN